MLTPLKIKLMNTETKPLQIFPAMCSQQKADLETLLAAIDDFGATTLALTNGPQGYVSFIEARDSVRSRVLTTAKNYRFVN